MKFYTRQRRMPQVIIVSLIDVFVILLIFVIVTTTFKREQPAVTIALPESKTATAADNAQEPVILTITPEGKIYLDAEEYTLETLKPAIQKMVQTNAKRPLALNADKESRLGTMIGVLDVLREAGVKGNLSAFMETLKK
jgi:biopolymer transport protein ExbD